MPFRVLSARQVMASVWSFPHVLVARIRGTTDAWNASPAQVWRVCRRNLSIVVFSSAVYSCIYAYRVLAGTVLSAWAYSRSF